MVKTKEKEEQNRARPAEGGREGRKGAPLSSWRERLRSCPIFSSFGKARRWGEQTAILLARSKTSCLEIQAGETEVFAKFYDAIFIVMEYLLQ